MSPRPRGTFLSRLRGSRIPRFVAPIITGLVLTVAGPAWRLSAQDDLSSGSIDGRPPHSAIIVGVGSDMYPYAYEDGGRLQGFAVDIFDAVASEMGIRASRLPLINRDAGDMLKAGRIDAILFWSDTPERQKEMTASTPLLTLQTVVVVRKDEQRIRTLADLKGRILATGAPGTVASNYVREHVRNATELYSASPEEVLVQVSSGLADAGVLSRLTAVARIERLGLKNLRILEEGIDGYDVRYGFMVRRGDDRLLARLNEGITLIHRNGTYNRIYDTWFGRHEPRRFTREEVVGYVAAALALSLVAVSLALVRQRRLTRHIAAQGQELAFERALHALVFDTHPSITLVLESDGPGKPMRLAAANHAAARLCGFESAEAAGRATADLALRPEIANLLSEIEARWPVDGNTVVLEQRLWDSRRTLTTNLHPLAVASDGRRRLCVMATEVRRPPATP